MPPASPSFSLRDAQHLRALRPPLQRRALLGRTEEPAHAVEKGQTHLQNARPTASTSTAMTMDTTARAAPRSWVAIMVASAPSGHNAENVSQPKPESVPHAPRPRSVRRGQRDEDRGRHDSAQLVRVHSRLLFRRLDRLDDERAPARPIRWTPPSAIRTLSHAPHPLHLSSQHGHVRVGASPVSSMRLVGARVVAVTAPRVAECKALRLVDHGQTQSVFSAVASAGSASASVGSTPSRTTAPRRSRRRNSREKSASELQRRRALKPSSRPRYAQAR